MLDVDFPLIGPYRPPECFGSLLVYKSDGVAVVLFIKTTDTYTVCFALRAADIMYDKLWHKLWNALLYSDGLQNTKWESGFLFVNLTEPPWCLDLSLPFQLEKSVGQCMSTFNFNFKVSCRMKITWRQLQFTPTPTYSFCDKKSSGTQLGTRCGSVLMSTSFILALV